MVVIFRELLYRVVVRSENFFFFWFWFMVIVLIVMLVFVVGISILNRSEKIEILLMFIGVWEYFELGKFVKVEVGRDCCFVKVFVCVLLNVGGEIVFLFYGLGLSFFLYWKFIFFFVVWRIFVVVVDFLGVGLLEKFYFGNDVLNEENCYLGFF